MKGHSLGEIRGIRPILDSTWDLGREHGKAAAQGFTGTSEDIPSPFSGEWAGDFSLLDLYEEIGVDVEEVADYMTDIYADTYEKTFTEQFLMVIDQRQES